MTNKKGFTLIELLVVVAIIGILATVVLASLGTARNKAKDSAAKSSISSMRAQAELFAIDHAGSYDDGTNNVCNDTAFAALATDAESQTGGTAGTCADTATAWAYELKLNNGNYFCADSTGRVVEGGTTAYGVSDTDPVCS